MTRKRKSDEKLVEIKKKRCSYGYFTGNEMAKMFCDHGIKMTRQTYMNKETGYTKFTIDEVQILSSVFEMDLQSVIHLFNDWD